MDHRRERFQQQLAHALDTWNHETGDLVRRAREVKMMTGADLSGEIARLQATRSMLVDELDALWADPDDAALDKHAERVQRTLERFDRTFAHLSERTESIYDGTVREAMRRRTDRH